jgi:hypothetical protein
VFLGRVLDDDAVGHGWGPPFEGVDAVLGLLEELLGVGDVLRDAAGVSRVAYGSLREEPPLVVVVGAGRGPVGEQVVLTSSALRMSRFAARVEVLRFLVCERSWVIVGGQRWSAPIE